MTTNSTMKKRRGKLLSHLFELMLGLGFVLSLQNGQDLLVGDGVTTADRLIGALVPIGLITLWFGYYFYRVMRMDEFQRQLEIQASAFAGIASMWIVIVWGTFGWFFDMEDAPIIFAAPVVAGVYGLARLYMMVRYR